MPEPTMPWTPEKPQPCAKPLRTMLSDGLTHVVQNWKTTVSGFLTITLTTTATLLPLGVLTPKETAYALIAQSLCKAYVALIQQDGRSSQTN